MNTDDFELSAFTPYLLNMAAEAQGEAFAQIYKSRYGMLRTEWRVLYHLGRYGALSATEISRRARLHKTKVSRAVRALEQKRFLERTQSDEDHRIEHLALRPAGHAAFRDLTESARAFEQALTAKLGQQRADMLRSLLHDLGA